VSYGAKLDDSSIKLPHFKIDQKPVSSLDEVRLIGISNGAKIPIDISYNGHQFLISYKTLGNKERKLVVDIESRDDPISLLKPKLDTIAEEEAFEPLKACTNLVRLEEHFYLYDSEEDEPLIIERAKKADYGGYDEQL